MSQPKRYKFAAYIYDGKPALSMMDTDGKNSFVHYSDYAALAAENERLNSLLLDLSDAVHFHRANADTAKCSATIDRIVAEVDKMHPIS